jgi:prevent-host-death family protein
VATDAPIGPSGRALFVHDGSTDAGRVPAIARNAGFELVEAANDRDALRALEHGQIDLVLSDIQLSMMDGAEMLRSIRARSDVPIILLTAVAQQNLAAVQAAELGAAQYLVKPIDGAALERVLKLALRPERARRLFLADYRNRRGEKVVPAVFTATDAKKDFGRALDIAAQGGLVVVTKHDDAKAVMLSIEEFNALVEPDVQRLEHLRQEFDVLLADMQKPSAKAAMKAAFSASPQSLGKAAAAAASKRG